MITGMVQKPKIALQMSFDPFVGDDVRAASPVCVVCGAASAGDLFCCRACAIEQQRRVFGVPLREFLIDRGRFRQDAEGVLLLHVLQRHGIYPTMKAVA